MASSRVVYGNEEEDGERPRAWRKRWSTCWMAALVAGELVIVESTEREVDGDGRGRGKWVAMNMW